MIKFVDYQMHNLAQNLMQLFISFTTRVRLKNSQTVLGLWTE